MKKNFPMRFLNFSLDDFALEIDGDFLDSFAIPVNQTTASAYPILLSSQKLGILELRSAIQSIEDWDEVGSLVIHKLNVNEYKGTIFDKLQIFKIPMKLRVDGITKLVYEDDSVVVESGITFRDENQGYITVCAGAATGSVTITTSFESFIFMPEFSLNQLSIVPL